MIVANHAWFGIFGQSDAQTAAEVTAALAMEPDRGGERGTPRLDHPLYPTSPAAISLHPCATWIIDASDNGESEDETGMASVRILIERIRGSRAGLEGLRANYTFRLGWSGGSDSSQGGFVIPRDVLVDLAWIGCELAAFVYLDDDGDDY